MFLWSMLFPTRSQAGQGSEQPDLVEGVAEHAELPYQTGEVELHSLP